MSYMMQAAFDTAAYPQDWVIGTDGRVAYVNNGYEPDEIAAVVEQERRAIEPGGYCWPRPGAAELQLFETYDAHPLPRQLEPLQALRDAGADWVTGISSHVPKIYRIRAPERGGGFLSWGLGSFLFDQMGSLHLRSQLYLEHTVHRGRAIQTRILVGMLEDYGQPRWATPAERTQLFQLLRSAEPPPPGSMGSVLPG